MKHIALVLMVICFIGCARTERLRALKQADQAAQAIQLEVVKEQPDMQKIGKLIEVVRMCLGPSFEDVKVDTTVDMASVRTPEFVHRATIQAGKAQSESETTIGAILESPGFDGLLFTGLGVLCPALAVFGKRALDAYRLNKKANNDQTAYSEDAAKAMTPEELKEVQDKHYKRQLANGTHKLLYERRKT